MKIVKLLIVAGFATLAGCASLNSFFGTPTGTAVTAAAVDVAVATAEQKGISAAQINAVAKAALAADTGVAGTLAAVAGLVEADVAKTTIPAGDKAAIDILVATLASEITAKVGSNATLAATQAAAAVVLEQVIVATGG